MSEEEETTMVNSVPLTSLRGSGLSCSALSVGGPGLRGTEEERGGAVSRDDSSSSATVTGAYTSPL